MVAALVKPLGAYLTRVLDGTFLACGPIERPLYRLAGVDPREEQSWLGYALALLAFNLAGVLVLYALQRLQGGLPLNPAGMAAVPPELAFNTAVSFVTNTNWQNYGGETTMSHLTQMAGLTVQNFVSAATGVAVAVAVIRGFARVSARKIGNFWVDLTRITLFVLLPVCLYLRCVLIFLGHAADARRLDRSDDARRRQADHCHRPGCLHRSQSSMLGTNGGGFFNVNAAHPFENPTAVDRGEGSQARDARDPVATARDARLYRHRRGVARGHRLDRQRRPAPLLRGPLCLHLGGRQQWLGLRRPDRQHALVQRNARGRDADGPLSHHRAGAGHRRQPRGQEDRPRVGGLVPDPRRVSASSSASS